MSDNKYSSDQFFLFIDFLSKKNHVKPATARNWKNAALQLFSVLEQDELVDLRKIDVDQLVKRFENAKGFEVTGASINTYKGRYNSALSEFLSWVSDKASYRPAISSRNRGGNGAGKTKNKDKPKEKQLVNPPPYQPPTSSEVEFPIPIRDGHVVRIVNLPHDLTSDEAEKISAVVKALGTRSPKD